MTARDRIEAYYQSLREGEPLAPYFAPEESLVKFGISETLRGYETVRAGLQEQTDSTTEWRVESTNLHVTRGTGYAWFSDEVEMAWTDTTTGTRHAFDSRWSGTLERREEWRFVGMHVSAPHSL